MKKLFFLAIYCAWAALNYNFVSAEANNFQIGIKEYFIEQGQKKTATGFCSFTVEEGTFGRAGFTFYKDGGYSTTCAGGVTGPIKRLSTETQSKVSAAEVVLTADLYLKAFATKDRNIHLKGTLIKLTQAGQKNSPLFEYSEEELDYILPNDGKRSLLLLDNYDGKQVYAELTVRAEGELAYAEKVTQRVWFETEYYLYNEDSKKYELEGKNCRLGLIIDSPGGKATCSRPKVFKLTKGDSLLYRTEYEIKEPTIVDQGRIKFQLEVRHAHFLNPIMDHLRPEVLHSDKNTVVVFNKEITVAKGERIEIEIPQTKGSLLPFKSKETIVLINSIEEVKK